MRGYPTGKLHDPTVITRLQLQQWRAGTIMGATCEPVRGAVVVSVRLWVRNAISVVRFTSKKEQNIPRRSLYHPAAC